jgi:PKD repeat protein/glucose/arabinose dehydrogenase
MRRFVSGGLAIVLTSTLLAVPAAAQEPPAEGDFERVVLDDNTANPMELDVAADGRVLYIERAGQLRIVKPDGSVLTAGTVPVYTGFENGLLGLTLDPGFATNHHVWLFYSAPSQPEQHVSRFTLDGDTLDLASEQVVLRIPHQRSASNHSAGSLYFGPTGDLFISTGDDTFCCASGFAPIDEGLGRSDYDAQKSSSNTNDLRGKLLRITPRADGSGYEIPAGNLFAPGTERTRPEIYAMGFRNPFRFTVDQETGWVLLGDYGPDATAPDPNRGPAGHVEQNLIKGAGNYGWPYCIANNKPYRDYDFSTGVSGPPFDCAAPRNDSPNNTGLVDLPPIVPANIWYSYGDPPEPEFDGLPGGGAPMGGPRYHFDASNPNPRKFPAYFDDKWFIYEWNSNYIKALDFDTGGVPRNIESFMPSTAIKRPMDMDFGPDGAMYLIEWGTGFGGNNDDSGVYRIEYAKDLRPPRITAADAQPREGLAPLPVEFSVEATDPDGGPLTYLWEFGDGATSTEPDPTHTYTTNGYYTAKVTVTDAQGDTAVRNFPISVGNTAPEVTIELPPEGAIAAFGEEIPYRLRIEDAEDAQIDCTRAVVQVLLGHDEHAHPMTEYTPDADCEGTVRTEADAAHGDTADIFPVIEARYTDTGGQGLEPLTGRDLSRLQPRRKQAEFFTDTGRLQTSSYGAGDPGVTISPTPDPDGGGTAVGFIDDAEWISFDPVNLAGIESVTLRWAQEYDGSWIEMRLGAPDGPLVARTAAMPRTPGGWGDFRNITLPIADPGGTHELFFVFRNPEAQHDLANLNWVQFNAPPAGNTRPAVTLELPEDGAFADGGDGVRYRVAATDAEDGAVDCADITLAVSSGPARGTQQADASCEGLIQLPGEPGNVRTHVEATYTDAGGLTGHDVAVLHPKRVQAEFWERTGRTADSTAPNAPGVQNTGSGDPAGGGNAIGYIDDGDWVSYGPMSLTRIDAISYRAGSPSGMTIEVRRGSPTGDVVAEAEVPATGGYGNYVGVTVPVEGTGSHELFFVFRGPEGSHDLANVNWIDFEGRGASDNSAPRLTASAEPTEGLAPLEVDFTASATDPEGDAIAYRWDFGVPGAPPADTPEAAYTYTEPGDYTATVTVTDARGASRSQTFQIEVSGDCADPKPPDEGYISVFDGTAASLDGWQHIGAGGFDLANCMITTDDGYGILWFTEQQFADFELKFDMRTNVLDANSSIMLRNPDPGGDINLGHHVQVLDSASNPEPNKTGAIYGFRQADEIAPKPGEWREMRIRVVGRTYTVIIDGVTVNEYVDDGRTSDAVRGVARDGLRPLMGYIGLENHDPITRIDFRDIQVKDLGEPQPGCALSDDFGGTALDTARWDSIVREDPSGYRVQDGGLEIDTRPGTLTATGNSFPPNLVLQDPPEGDWTLETVVEAPVDEAFQQGGLIAYSSDDHYVKLDVVADNAPGAARERRVELFAEQRAQISSQSLSVPADAGDTWHLRLTKTGDTYRGEASQDGVTWSTVGEQQAPQLPAAKVGVFAVGESAQGVHTLAFDEFRATPDPACDAEPAPPTVQVSAKPASGDAPLRVRFKAVGRDPDGPDGRLGYAWDLGDGERANGRRVNHRYTEPGTYTATVTVTDRDGLTASAEVDVTVEE